MIFAPRITVIQNVQEWAYVILLELFKLSTVYMRTFVGTKCDRVERFTP